MRKSLTAALVALGAFAASTGQAHALTLGSAIQPAGSSASGCDATQFIAQLGENTTTPYKVPGPGRITAWQTNTADPEVDAGGDVTFGVFRQTPGNDLSYTVVGAATGTVPSPKPAGGISGFILASPIAVQAGDTIGLLGRASTDAVCYFAGGSIPAGSGLMRLNAPITPMAGQTLAKAPPDSPPGYTLNLSATFEPAAPPPPKKKKCKRKKKKSAGKSAASAGKKKGCGKKKRKG